MCASSEFEAVARLCGRHAHPSGSAASDVVAEEKAVAAYAARCCLGVSIVGPGAIVTGCTRLERSCVGAHARVEGSIVVESTVLGGCEGNATVVSESHLERSIVQRGCTIVQKSVVIGSLMCAGSHVRRHGTLVSSVLASFSSVEEGEVGSSLVGPLVGFHHQVRAVPSRDFCF